MKMSVMPVLTVGLIASDLKISEKLSTQLSENGVILEERIKLEELKTFHVEASNLDVWLIDLAEDDWNDLLDVMLDEAKVPVFINEQEAFSRQEHPTFWVKKLLVRLGELVLAEPTSISGKNTIAEPKVRDIEIPSSVSLQPQLIEDDYPIWVLAASLGGPAALKRFLQALPDELPGGFILVQHIDNNFVPVLSKILEDYSSLKVKLAEKACRVNRGEIIIAPVERKLVMTSTGMLIQNDTKWTPPYSPCIDDILIDVVNHWPNCGAIIFSGMGGDGVVGAEAMHKSGRPVWVQEPNSCANSTMPDDVANAGYANFSGTPEQLAQQLVAQFHRQTQAAKLA